MVNFRKDSSCPGRIAQLVEAPSCAPKGCGLDCRSGHIPGFRVRFPDGDVLDATDGCFSLSLVNKHTLG